MYAARLKYSELLSLWRLFNEVFLSLRKNSVLNFMHILLLILLTIYDLKYWFIAFRILIHTKSINTTIIVLFRKFGSMKSKTIFIKKDEKKDNSKFINVEISKGYA